MFGFRTWALAGLGTWDLGLGTCGTWDCHGNSRITWEGLGIQRLTAQRAYAILTRSNVPVPMSYGIIDHGFIQQNKLIRYLAIICCQRPLDPCTPSRPQNGNDNYGAILDLDLDTPLTHKKMTSWKCREH